MLNPPKVSVYIATHNRKDLLIKAVESVLNQTYENIEIIIVNDGSSDNTQVVLDTLAIKFSNIKVFINDSAKGAAFSRNIAIKASTGMFITGLDDDDYFTPNRINDFINHWSNTYSFLFSNYQEFDGILVTKNLPRKKIIGFSDIKKRNYVGNQIFTTKNKIMEIGGFDEKLEAWEDYDLWFRLIASFGPAKVINNHSYLLNVENSRQRITNSSNIMLACEQFIEKHSDTLTSNEKNYHEINAIYDTKYKITLKQCLLHSKDLYSTIRVIKTYLITRKSPFVKKCLKCVVTLINFMK
jgi:glycosyltransferase involved in cell wall biosynthesis